MSVFSDAFAPGFAALLETFGQAVTYRDAEGEYTAVTAIVRELSAEERQEMSGREGRGREIERVQKLILPRTAEAAGSDNFIASPKTTATIERDGTTWSVREILKQSDVSTTVAVVEIGKLDHTRHGYRR